MNEERHLNRCLDSLKWCDEIILIDSGSTDQTLSIAEKYNCKIITRSWPGYVEQKRFGLAQCSHDWVLNIDADEVVSDKLRERILSILSQDNIEANGFEIQRTVYHLGRWWRKGGYFPEYRLRLMRRLATSWGGNDPHERAIVSGVVCKLPEELLHYTYEDLYDQVQTINRFSSLSAKMLFDAGKRAGIINIIFNPLFRFIKFYFFKRGFLEGLPGLIVAFMEFFYTVLKYGKLWELQHKSKLKPD